MSIAAMKLALEALRFALHVGFDESSESQIKKGDKAIRQHQDAITALRTAIAEAEKVDYADEADTEELLAVGKLPEPLRLAAMLEKTMQWPLHGKAADCLRKMYVAQHEPVAWMGVGGTIWKKYSRPAKAANAQPLYIAPPAAQRQPLTDEAFYAMAEVAWRAGWAACRDAEFVGEEVEDETWGEQGVSVMQDIKAKHRIGGGE